jgi:hypothetical protein
MNTFNIRLESFAGADIDSCCRDACRLADQLQIVVMFPFNGVTCMARPGDDPHELSSAWDDELRSKHTYKLACASRYIGPARGE